MTQRISNIYFLFLVLKLSQSVNTGVLKVYTGETIAHQNNKALFASHRKFNCNISYYNQSKI